MPSPALEKIEFERIEFPVPACTVTPRALLNAMTLPALVASAPMLLPVPKSTKMPSAAFGRALVPLGATPM
jgi:hypothetical protein